MFAAHAVPVETAAGAVDRRARVILAVPAYVAASLLRGFDTTLAALCEAMPYASTATVALGYRREQIAAPDARHRLRRPARRAQPAAGRHLGDFEVAAAARQTDTCCCAAFLGGGRDPRRLDADDAELVSLRVEELTQLLGITGDAAVHAPLPLDAAEPAVRGRSPAARGDDRSASWRPSPACSSPAAASARSGFPTASPTGARPPRVRRRFLHATQELAMKTHLRRA